MLGREERLVSSRSPTMTTNSLLSLILAQEGWGGVHMPNLFLFSFYLMCECLKDQYGRTTHTRISTDVFSRRHRSADVCSGRPVHQVTCAFPIQRGATENTISRQNLNYCLHPDKGNELFLFSFFFHKRVHTNTHAVNLRAYS